MKKIALLLVSLGLASPQSVYAQNAFDFRGARLGMTLKDFRALPPLQKETVTVERDGTPAMSSEPGIIKCYSLENVIQSREIRVLDAEAYDTCEREGDAPFTQRGHSVIMYRFVKDSAGVARLYHISMKLYGQNSHAPDAISMLTERWGKGARTKSTVQNRFGATFPKTRVVWRKKNAYIELQSPCGLLDGLCIHYVETKLEARSKAGAPPAENKF